MLCCMHLREPALLLDAPCGALGLDETQREISGPDRMACLAALFLATGSIAARICGEVVVW